MIQNYQKLDININILTAPTKHSKICTKEHNKNGRNEKKSRQLRCYVQAELLNKWIKQPNYKDLLDLKNTNCLLQTIKLL